MHGVGLVSPLADIQLLLRDSGAFNRIFVIKIYLSFAGFWDEGGGSCTDSFAAMLMHFYAQYLSWGQTGGIA